MAKIKGTSFGQTVAALKANPAAAARLEPRLRKYLDPNELVSVADWYPEDDQISLLRAVVQQLGGGAHVWEQMGRAAARHALTRVYKSMLREGDPTATVRKMPVIWSSYHDTGRLTVTITGPCEATYTLVDYGAPTREMCSINTGYYRGMIELAGGGGIEVSHDECVHSGSASCVWHAKWSDPD